MTTLNITQARTRLLSLARQMSSKSAEAVEVTHRGKPVLAILPFELYETLMETMEVLADAEQAARLRNSLAEMRQGKAIPWEKAKKRLGV